MAHVYPLQHIADRFTAAICFLNSVSNVAHMVTGGFEDLGSDPARVGGINFVFRADPPLVEAFKRNFDLQWAKSRSITTDGVTSIPHLIVPNGTEEAAKLWDSFRHACTDAPVSDGTPQTIARIDPDTGEVELSQSGHPIVSPAEEIGCAKLDAVADRIARLYDKGSLVSVDKLSRIPPLDVPLDPHLFGDSSNIQRGNVARRVNMRITVLDARTLRQMETRRRGLRTLLTKFTFALADNMRWMPSEAQGLFDSELKRLNEEGQKLISDLLTGDVTEFIKDKRAAMVADINAMYAALGKPERPHAVDLGLDCLAIQG